MRVFTVALATCALVALQVVPAVALPGEKGKVIPPAECNFEAGELGSYIVVFNDWVADPEAVALQQVKRYDGILGFIYKYALKGYSADYPPESAEALQAEPTVKYIEVSRLNWVDESSGVRQWYSCPLAPPLGPPPPSDPEVAGSPAPQSASAGALLSPGAQPAPAGAPPAPTPAVHCSRAKASRGKRCASGGNRAVRVCNQRAVAAKRRC